MTKPISKEVRDYMASLGQRGGASRAKALTAKRRRQIAMLGVQARRKKALDRQVKSA